MASRTRGAAAAARARAGAVARSKLSGDEQGVLCLSSASEGLRALLPPAARRQLRTDYEEATALCLKVGMRDCKELREATDADWCGKRLSASDLATLATLGSVLPALEFLSLAEHSGSAGPDGVQRLAEGLVAGSLPAVIYLCIYGMHMGDAGAAALAAALDRGAPPRLRRLTTESANPVTVWRRLATQSRIVFAPTTRWELRDTV